MAFTLYESRYSITCECCGTTQNASDFDGIDAVIETDTCKTCNAELCEYCESFQCEDCKGRFCAIHEHSVHDGEFSLCPGCFEGWLADQEYPEAA